MLHEKLKKKIWQFSQLFEHYVVSPKLRVHVFMFVNKRKMPENCDFDDNEAAEFIDNAGVSKNTTFFLVRQGAIYNNVTITSVKKNNEIIARPERTRDLIKSLFLRAKRGKYGLCSTLPSHCSTDTSYSG